MFYSHQLLCKKGPLGQIWIAATMKAKINRKRTEEIDIEEICMQILQPQVPLALRLSGILMGGIVLVFHRKVKFLHDDVTEFLLKIKTALSAKANDCSISLPQGKSQARYENVTIKYDFDAFDDIERPLMCPTTPERRDFGDDVLGGREYVFVSGPRDPPRQLFDVELDNDHYRVPDHFQANSADITLQEDNVNPSSNEQLYDFGTDIQDERFPATEKMDFEQFFQDLQPSDEINPATNSQSNPAEDQGQEPVTGLEDSPTQHVQKNSSVEEEAIGPESPEHGEATAAAAPTQKKRRRRGVYCYSVFDAYTEISATVFESWLRKPEDIVGRGKIQIKDSVQGLRVQKLFQLPSGCLSRRSCVPKLAPDWTCQLTNLWNQNFGVNLPQPGGPNKLGIQRSPHVATASPSFPNNSLEDNQTLSNSQYSGPSHGHHGGEFYSSSSSEARANSKQDSGQLQQVPIINGSTSRGQPDLTEYGSIEKLRTALHTPSSGSEDHLWGGSQPKLTPNLSGQLGTSAGGRPKHRLSTPGSAKLPFDVEVEPAFTGGSGRFKKARLSSPAMGSGDLPANDYYAEYDLPGAADDTGISDYFANLRGSLRGSLTQFELLEETGPSTQGTGQPEVMNNVSITVLQLLRQNFKDLGVQCKEHQSLDALSNGLNRSEAAKLFYQVLVLTSNNFLAVSQDVPYGDILIGRGLYT